MRAADAFKFQPLWDFKYDTLSDFKSLSLSNLDGLTIDATRSVASLDLDRSHHCPQARPERAVAFHCGCHCI
jgi:hypothetical protein